MSPAEQRLAIATKAAIQAAGGLVDCARDTGLSTSQLSRCCSPHHRDSLSLRDAVTIEAVGHGVPGHPFILRALAQAAGFTIVQVPDGIDDPSGLMRGVVQMASELGDVSALIVSALADDIVSPVEAQAALAQLDDLDAATSALRGSLMALAYPPRPAST